jgi:hypothetical protein
MGPRSGIAKLPKEVVHPRLGLSVGPLARRKPCFRSAGLGHAGRGVLKQEL